MDCPIDHERILADPTELSNLRGVDSRSGRSDSPSDVHEIRKYVDLVVWCWGDGTRASLSAMYRLAQKRLNCRFSYHVEGAAIFAVRKLIDRSHVRRWWESHFVGLIAARPRFRPQLSLLHLALIMSAEVDRVEDILSELALERQAQVDAI